MFASLYGVAATAALAVITTVLAMECTMDEHPWFAIGAGWEQRRGHDGPAWGYAGGRAVIAFKWDEGEGAYGGSIYTIREDGTGLRLLSPSVGDGRALGSDQIAYDASPAISPDGTRVAYATLRESRSAGRFNIVTMTLDGNERRSLTDDLESQGEPSWSPDGTRIAFLKDQLLHTMAPDGSAVQSTASKVPAVSEPPAWSPDGTRLVFRGQDGALYVVGANGSNPTRVAEGVTGGPVRYSRPAWSPDSQHLAFVRRKGDGERILHLTDVGEGTVRAITSEVFGPLLWSPDGTEILFGASKVRPADSVSHVPGLHALTVDGSLQVRRVSDLGTNRILGLAWSLDDTRLAILMAPFSFYGDRALNVYADVVLCTVAPDGSDLRVLVRVGPEGELVAEGETGR